MIISKTPYRVSFVGGGTDLPGYYTQYGGSVISTAIDRYMYVSVHRRFENNIRVSYSTTEISNSVDELKHELVRASLKKLNINDNLEITTTGDVPSGTGLGSSSTLTVGLLNALSAYRNTQLSNHDIAKLACDIELDDLGKPIGKQDQYAAAIGGFNKFKFLQNGDVEIRPLNKSFLDGLFDRIILLYTGQVRNANEILGRQSKTINNKFDELHEMSGLVDRAIAIIDNRSTYYDDDYIRFSRLIDESWLIKKSFDNAISNDLIDRWYDIAKSYGAYGGKLLGAGGGGFLMVIGPRNIHKIIIDECNCEYINFKGDKYGSRILLNNL